MIRNVSWIKAALRDFQTFPVSAQSRMTAALRIAAHGETADIAKPMSGLGSGVFEIAVKDHGDAYRVVYALQLDDDIWVVHAFQKKSSSGIKPPKHHIDLIRERINRLKAELG